MDDDQMIPPILGGDDAEPGEGEIKDIDGDEVESDIPEEEETF